MRVVRDSESAIEPDEPARSGTSRIQCLDSMWDSRQSDAHFRKLLRVYVRSKSLGSLVSLCPASLARRAQCADLAYLRERQEATSGIRPFKIIGIHCQPVPGLAGASGSMRGPRLLPRTSGSDIGYTSVQNHYDPPCACARPRWRVGLNARTSLTRRTKSPTLIVILCVPVPDLAGASGSMARTSLTRRTKSPTLVHLENHS